MDLILNLTFALFSGWLTNSYLGKNNNGFLGYFVTGVIGSILGVILFKSLIIGFIHPILVKLITTLLGTVLFQIGLNLITRERKEQEDTKKQTKLT